VAAWLFPQEVWRVRHSLHAPSEDDVVVADTDEGIGQRQRTHAGAADTVDRLGWHVDADAHAEGDLPSWALTGAALQDLPENGVLNVARRDTRPLHRRPRRDDAESPRALARRGAVQFAEWGARPAENHCPPRRVCHRCPP